LIVQNSYLLSFQKFALKFFFSFKSNPLYPGGWKNKNFIVPCKANKGQGTAKSSLLQVKITNTNTGV